MKLRRIAILGLALLALMWTVYFFGSVSLVRPAAARLGDTILKATDGNVANAGVFIQNRLREAAVLLSLAVALVLGESFITPHLLASVRNPNGRWISHAILGFVCVNVWLALAMHTMLFWLFFWQGREGTTAQARFELKHHLLQEYSARHKAVILGNSQARAQMDEALLNAEFAPELFTGELHFPGSSAFDIWLAHRRVKPDDAQIVICYVSELNFYSRDASETAPFFFDFADWHATITFGGLKEIPPRKLAYGLFGSVLPVFHLREPFASRILGTGVSGIRQRQHNQTLRTNLVEHASSTALEFRFSELSEFQKRAFASFVIDCEQQHQTLMLVCGQLNPLVGSQIDPALRKDMLAFLRNLHQHFPELVLVDDCPPHVEADYDDMTHVNKQRQLAFTRFIAEKVNLVLKRLNYVK